MMKWFKSGTIVNAMKSISAVEWIKYRIELNRILRESVLISDSLK
jgi:hypothetical protein